MVGWLVGWLAGWLVGWLAAWLVGWFVGWLVGWLAGWLTHLFFQDAGGEVPKAGKDIYKGRTYNITDDLLAVIRAATNSQDIPKKDRNKLFAAINRNIDKPEVPAQVLARWTMDRKCHKTAFLFMKEWAEDTTFASCTVTEEHNRRIAAYTKTEFTWMTKYDIYKETHAYHDQGARSFADKIMEKALTKPHTNPAHRDDPDFLLYKVTTHISLPQHPKHNPDVIPTPSPPNCGDCV